MNNREKRDSEYPIELEAQFIMRLPEEPAKLLREVLQSGENFKNRLSIKLDPDMRHGEVRFDHWLLYGRIMDLPTIVESLKTIDRKSVYKTADICQIMVCKTEMDPKVEEESSIKNKKKDPYKVDKKFLWPHGITPPTKNVRKRRFRKTLKKKNMEGPEIEREVKRLLRADNEAMSVTWEVLTEEDDHNIKHDSTTVILNKSKINKETKVARQVKNISEESKVEDIFGGALSESDVEDENIDVELKDSSTASFHNSTGSNISSLNKNKKILIPGDLDDTYELPGKTERGQGNVAKQSSNAFETISTYNDKKEHLQLEIQQVITELEELKLRRQKTQHEIVGLQNMTLRQRFQDILHNINKEILLKENEYRKLKSILN